MSRERPILFSGPMVRAIIEGRKTQTRRLVGLDTLLPSTTTGYDWTFRGQAPVRSLAQQRRHPAGCWQDLRHDEFMELCPHGQPSDRLWVRETWCTVSREHHTLGDHPQDGRPRDGEGWWAWYAATEPGVERLTAEGEQVSPWRPSIHMPRWASRITLEVTSVRVQRLQDISEEDALAEGCDPDDQRMRPSAAFRRLWNDINAKRAPWDSNPWVWAITFKRLPAEEASEA